MLYSFQLPYWATEWCVTTFDQLVQYAIKCRKTEFWIRGEDGDEHWMLFDGRFRRVEERIENNTVTTAEYGIVV